MAKLCIQGSARSHTHEQMKMGPPVTRLKAITSSLRRACIDLLNLLIMKKHPKPFFICFDEAHTLTAKPQAETRTKTSFNNLEWVLSYLRHFDLGEDTLSPSNSESKNLHQSQPSQPEPSRPTADEHKPGHVFTLFMSTASDIGELAMPADRHPSHRVRPETILFPPHHRASVRCVCPRHWHKPDSKIRVPA